MRNRFSKLQYLLFALLMFALAGCGANGTATTASNGQSSTITAKLSVAKEVGKKFANYSAGAASQSRLKVTGATIPTVDVVFPGTNGGQLSVYPGSNLIVTAQFLDASGNVVYEGFATNVSVAANSSATVNITLSYPITKAADMPCLSCHDSTSDATGQNLVADFKQSAHYTNTTWSASPRNDGGVITVGTGCAGCHGQSHNDTNPVASGRCFQCHGATLDSGHQGTALQFACNKCHQSHNSSMPGCVDCHAVGQNVSNLGTFVNDNNGVRAIIPEFQKNSHHIYNGPTALPTNAQCAVCHLEGKRVGNNVVVDTSIHMNDAKTHLRNANDDSDMQWDPAAPNHTTMDNFCFSCHDAAGAVSPGVADIQTVINADPNKVATATAGNPFGDLLSNKYDQVTRAQVVDVFTAMAPGNASHHAVRAPKYTVRTTTAGMTAVGQKTLFDGGLFVADYTPLGASVTVGDDSQLHCGDCHTVGQWKANTNPVTNKYNSAAIGAHGSVNEYMLRNSQGTDALHSKNSAAGAVGYVCFNCHNQSSGASPASGNYYSSGAHIGGINSSCNVDTAGRTGTGFLRYTTLISSLPAPGTLYTNMGVYGNGTTTGPLGRLSALGNITGISCTNCHNSGIRGGLSTPMYATSPNGSANSNPNTNSGFGGIHGGNLQYTGADGNPQTPSRFMSGMGNYKYVAPANVFARYTAYSKVSRTTYGITNPGTCYTNNVSAENTGYSSCNHHNYAKGETGASPIRKGGTLGNVTRPLSY